MNNYVGTLDRNVLYKQKNETFDMFSTIVEQDLTNTSLQVIKVVDNISTYITPSNHSFSIFKDLTKYTIVMPNEDCFVCVIFNNSSIMFRVGEPPLLLLIYKPGLNTDQFINLAFTQNGRYKIFVLLTDEFNGTSSDEKYIDITSDGLVVVTKKPIQDIIFDRE